MFDDCVFVAQERLRFFHASPVAVIYTDSYSNDMRNAHEKVVKELRIQ